MIGCVVYRGNRCKPDAEPSDLRVAVIVWFKFGLVMAITNYSTSLSFYLFYYCPTVERSQTINTMKIN